MLSSFLHLTTAQSAHSAHGRFIICSECDILEAPTYHVFRFCCHWAGQQCRKRLSVDLFPCTRPFLWSDIATSPLLRCPFVSWLLDLSTSVFCICLINWLACVSLRVSGQTKIDGLSDDTARFHSEMHTQEVFWSPFETVRCKIWSTSRFHSKLVCSRNCEICYHHIPIKYT